MCGLVGIVGNGINVTDLKIYRQMLIADTFRGGHSTGQFAIGATENYSMFKRAVPGWHFLEHKPADAMLTVQQRAIIGHNRYATQGKINNINAHPFDTGDVVGVHNGSLWDTSELKYGKDFDVDSEALIHEIAENGIEHAAAIADGAFALIWYDRRTRKLSLVRNDQRTLAVYLHPNRDVAYIASEINMLRWIVDRNDTSAFDENLLMPIAAGDLWEFDLSLTSKLTESCTYAPIEVASTYAPKKSWGGYSYGGYGNYSGGTGSKKDDVKSGGNSNLPAKTEQKQHRSYVRLCEDYKLNAKEDFYVDFNMLTQMTRKATNERAFNLTGKVLYPERLAGMRVSAYNVNEDIAGAGIFHGQLYSAFESDKGVQFVLNPASLNYLGDSKEVISFEKKTEPAH